MLDEFRQKLNRTRVHNFAAELSRDGRPLHLYTGGAKAADAHFTRNRDAILDLLMLALSHRMLVAPLAGRIGSDQAPQFSGFSGLAANLYACKPLLHQLLAPFPLEYNPGWNMEAE